jgi:hypothetical protein
VIEAADRIGGRAVDEESSKFTCQSHVVVGSCNNPIVVLCKQVGCILFCMLDKIQACFPV